MILVLIVVLVIHGVMEDLTGMVHDITGVVDQFTGMVYQFLRIMDNTVNGAHMDRIGSCEFAVVVAVLALSASGGSLQLAVLFQLGQQEDTHQSSGEAAALVCLLLVPGLERHFHTKQERLEHWVHLLEQFKHKV